jgi:hypothetical protein
VENPYSGILDLHPNGEKSTISFARFILGWSSQDKSSQVKLLITNYAILHCPYKNKSSQVKLLITNSSFCIVQRATAQSKAGFLRDFGVAEAPPGFQSGWSDCMYFSLSFCSFCLLISVFRVSFGFVEEIENWYMIRAVKALRQFCQSLHCDSE